MRKTFEKELEELNLELIGMAAAAEGAIETVTSSLKKNNLSEANSAIETARELVDMERDIESRCLKLLMQQQPVARDLRTISTALKMVTDLQRIGDQAANIAELSILLLNKKAKNLLNIPLMAQKAGAMVKRSIYAYVNRDVKTAEEVIKADDEVDELFVDMKRKLIGLMAEDGDSAEQAVDLIMIAKYLERTADHAVNIAQWAIFCVTGDLGAEVRN